MCLDEKKLAGKSGVSLITVLLLMLVATIAATATYKWITSEGRSSASRMLQREAYQSSVAGIENARTWMTFHANDVGALIKAYLEGGNKPISLDARLRPLQRAGQDYHVWLTGVNTENSTYKLKVLSSGEARNGTSHSEVAIFNVDGLYQVKVPQETVFSSVPFEHNYFGSSTQAQGHIKAHSLLVNGNLNGSNPVYTDVDLVVTGNVNITGSSVGAGGTACIGGNLNANNGVMGNDFYVEGNATSFTFPSSNEAAGVSNANLTGNVYINGDLGAPSTGSQKFQKNLTLNGTWTTNLGAQESSVAGNLCLGSEGQVVINSTSRTFQVGGNVWAESSFPIWWDGYSSEDNHSSYDRIILGAEASSNVYISTAHPSSDYVTMRDNRAFVESDDYFRGSSGNMGYGYYALRWDNRTYKPYVSVASADDKYYLYNYTGSGQDVDYVVNSYSWGGGMWGGHHKTYYANYYVDDEVFYTPATYYGWSVVAEKINYLNYSGSKATGSPYCLNASYYDKWRPECHVAPWFKSNGSVSRTFPATREFACAESVKEHCDKIWKKKAGCDGSKYKVDDILTTAYEKFVAYANKGCAVDTWNSNLSTALNACYQENSTDATKSSTNLYNGYQVVKVSDAGKSDPTTPLKGKFIIIVENQMGQQSLPPTTSDSYVLLYLTQGTSSTLQPAVNNGIYNYFIYTKNDIGGFMFNDAVFSGSIYATASSCAKVGDFKTRSMVYNEALMSDLATYGVICEASAGSSCGGVLSSSSSSGSASSEEGTTSSTGFDSYYISMAPQLGVRLESQYKADESLPSADELTSLDPSFIVLPRVIYLPSDPYGELPDYYNVQALNGSALTKSDVSVTCSGPGSLPTTGTLYSGTLLDEGIYTCKATASNHPNNSFWVVVGADTRGTPQVSFVEDKYEMGTSETKEVKVHVPSRAADLEINVYCPNVPNESWSYQSLGSGVEREGTSCTMTVSAGDEGDFTLATIKTEDAFVGTLTFQLLAGEGYIPGGYTSSELYMSSSAVLSRDAVTTDDISTYCEANPDDCPAAGSSWPDCSTDETWIEPSGVSYSNLVENSSWSIMVGNTQAVTLQKVSGFDDCVVIIPTSGNSIAANAVEANKTYTLRASAKAKSRSVKVGFYGDVGNGKNPAIVVSTTSQTTTCNYGDAVANDELSAKVCTISVFDNESISLTIKDTDDENFSYWKCTGESCPTTETVTSASYNAFSVTENGTVVLAHFGEADKHCFFDEFKNSSVECSGEDAEYCIDNCGNDETSVCAGVIDENAEYSDAKWHLVYGQLSQIEMGANGEIHAAKSLNKGKKESDRTSVKVVSTVNAGILGSLKALVNVPQVNSSYGRSAANIKNSGFMLRSTSYGTDYFMLNLYENSNGELEAQLWRGDVSLSAVLMNGSLTANVSNSSMIMATVTLTSEGTVSVSAFVGGYYSDNPTEYTCVFSLSDFGTTSADAAHEYVGFGLADPNFKIYGIGWQSDSYNSECHDTYPTVKCSFAAVATDGVIKTDTLVQPWIGHSGWFDSKSCVPLYYYYNGTDASTTCTSGSEATCSGGYQFDAAGAGAHGYTEDAKDMKTAKAWLGNCLNTDGTDVAWGVATEQERAHCGAFWTGEFKECTAHQSLFSGSQTAAYGSETTITFDSKQNLRAATLHITLENSDNNEVEIWLVSESDNWGSADHESHSVKMSGTAGSFDVMQEFATGSDGFDPENVKQIVLKNHGATGVAVTQITSTCANAIGITYCSAEFDGTQWNVMTQVTNKSLISAYNITAQVEGTERLNVTNSSDDILWNGDVAYMQIVDNPYEYQGKSYKFTSTMTGTASQTVNKECSVSPDPIGTVGVDCSVVGTVASGANFPTFNVNFSGCPAAGCSYEIYLDDASTPFATGTEQYSARHSANMTEDCTASAGCEHTYTVKSASGAAASFDDCSATFKVVKPTDNQIFGSCSFDRAVLTGSTAYLKISVEAWNKSGDNVSATLSGEDVSEAITINRYYNADKTITAPSEAGTYAYTITYDGEQFCTANLVVKDAGDLLDFDCPAIETYPLQYPDWEITTSGASSLTSEIEREIYLDGEFVKSVKCNKNYCPDMGSSQVTATVGLHNYVVKVDDQEVCKNTYEVKNPLVCTVDKTTIDRGGKVVFKASWVSGLIGQPSDCDFTGNGVPTNGNCSYLWNFNSNLEVTPTSSGEKKYEYAVTLNNNGASSGPYKCNWTINVNTPKPSFDCKANLKATIGESNNVTIGLENVTNCDEGGNYCYYSIVGTNINKSGNGYTGSSLPSFTDGNVTSASTKTYTVRLTNSVDYVEHDCVVEFTTASACKCSDYCTASQCANLRISGSFKLDGNCYFATSISYLNGTGYKVNGVSFNNYTSSGYPDPVDGGYYIVSTGTGYGSSATLGTPSPGCASYYTCTEKSCIAFVNGTGGYDQNCYSSGLTNHGSGKCYALQDGRSDAQNINDNAEDSYWWKEVDCDDFCI